jgi:3-oxoadipate enol-lactonase
VTGPYSMDRYADDLAALLAALGVERAVVCGLSMGGYVALAMLRRHRHLLRALVLCDTRATADGDEARTKRRRIARFIDERGMEALAEQQLEAQVGRTTRESHPEISESLRRMMASAPASGAISAQHAMAARADSSDLLATIDFPTLVVGGAEDAITPLEELRALAAAIPGSRLELIERAGHVCPYERPAAFNHIVGEFLGRLVYD